MDGINQTPQTPQQFTVPTSGTPWWQTKAFAIGAVVGFILVLAGALWYFGFFLEFGRTPAAELSPAPSGLALVVRCVGGLTPQVNLDWKLPRDASSNVLRRGLGEGELKLLFHESGPPFVVSSYIDTSVAAGRTYRYQVESSIFDSSDIVSVTVSVQNCQER